MAVRDWLSGWGILSRRRVLLVGGGFALPLVLLLAGLVVGMARPLLGEANKSALPVSFLRIATGSVSGPDYAIGGALARLVSQPAGSQPCEKGGRCGVPGLSAVAMASDGAIANIQLVAADLAETALAPADIVANAAAGRRAFQRTGPIGELRAIANLYPAALHLVVAKDAKIKSVRGLRGKRVSLDRPRSGANAEARLVLSHFGVPLGALDVHELDAAQAAERLAAGELDAFFVMGSWPVAIVTDLTARGVADVLPLREAALEPLFKTQPFLHGVVIPAGVYRGQGEIETVGSDVLWITRERLSPELVYSLCQALWSVSNRPVIASAHPIAALIDLESAARGLPVPLADGAEKFYRQRGVLPSTVLAQDFAPAPRPRPARVPPPQVTQ